MFCGKCGAQMPDDYMFCAKCGARLMTLSADSGTAAAQPVNTQPAQPVNAQPVQPVSAQPVPAAVSQPVQQPVYAQPVQPAVNVQPVTTQPVYAAPAFGGQVQRTGAYIRDIGKVNIFNGAGAIGVTYGAGFLHMFDDRLELQKTAGTSAGYGVNPIAGLVIAAADKKNHPLDVWYFSDIARIYSAKHAGMISKFVIQFKNGKALSFTLAGAKNAAPQVEEIVQFMQPYL